jgi:hypothetical protein
MSGDHDSRFDRSNGDSPANADETFAPRRSPGKATIVEREGLAGGELGIPGRSTLVQRAYADTPNADATRAAFMGEIAALSGGSVVQRLATRDEAVSEPSAIAASGMQGPAGTLPHYERIQRAFGRHDVSSVRAHVAGPAEPASKALGASAYAYDGAVAFASAPDLHTAAHEAAHVVQQRAGVQLKGLDGGPSDPYEQHADAVADAVVRGESAEQLLDGSRGGTPNIQRKPDEALSLPPGVNFQVQSDGQIVASTEWLLADPQLHVKGGETYLPSRTAAILRALKGQGLFAWMDDAKIPQYASAIHIETTLNKKEKFVRLQPKASIYAVIGPEPGRDISVVKRGDGLLVIMRTSTAMPTPVKKSTKVEWTPELRGQLLDGIEAYTGLKIDPYIRAQVRDSTDEWQPTVEPGEDGILVPAHRATMELFYGKDAWTSYLAKPSTDPGTTGIATTGGVTFSASVPEAERQFFLTWMKQVGASAPPKDGDSPTAITPRVLEMLHDLDKPGNAALKAKVIARLKGSGGGPPQGLDAGFLDQVITAADADVARDELKMKPEEASNAKPLFDEPVRGAIINRAGLNYVGQNADFYFETQNHHDAFAVPHVYVKWVVVDVSDPSKHLKEGHTDHIEFETPDTFEFEWPKPGTYRIHAFVTHSFYQSSHTSINCAVKTESERMQEVNDKAFAGLKGATTFDSGTNEYPFDVSWFNTMFGSHKEEYGTWTEGTTPEDFKRLDYKDRVKFLARDKRALEEMVKAHTSDHTLKGEASDPRWKDMIAYARDELKQLKDQQDTLDRENKDSAFFEARGSFLSRKNGIADATLKLVASAKKEDKAIKATLHDFTQLYEPTTYTFSATGTTFNKALEAMFVDLCKSYPPGRVSCLFENLDDGLKPLKTTTGLEFDTGTAWKDVKSVAYNPSVKMAVNIVGAVTMIFVPGSGAILFPLLATYNSVETIDNLAELRAKGALTSMNVATGVAEIGLNFLPFIGELKPIAEMGKVARYALEGATIAGMGAIMTVQAIETIRQIRDQQVTEVAKLDGEIRERERTNPSDPQLPVLRAQLEAKVKEAREVSAKVFMQVAESGAIMLVQMAALKSLERNMAAKSIASMKEEGLFSHVDGAEPHYDPKTGTIKGDEAKVGKLKPEDVAKLKQAYSLDMAAKQAELANVLGTDNVTVTRGGSKVTITKDGEVYKVEIPTEKPFSEAIDEAWNFRKANDPNAPATRPKPVVAEIKPTLSPADVVSQQNIAIGTHLHSEGEAHAVLGRLAAGDPVAFKVLGMEAPPADFDLRGVEWGIGQLPDGSYIIIRGQGGAVDWAHFSGVRPVAHSHPLTPQKLIKGGATTFDDLMKGGGQGTQLNKVNIFPSAADVAFCARNALGEHVVQTPYVSKGGGRIGNPTPGAHEPLVQIKIIQPERVGSWTGNPEMGVFKSKMVATDTSGKVLWSGDVWTVDHDALGSLVEFNEPPQGLWTKGIAGIDAAAPPPSQTKAGGIPPDHASRLFQKANSHADREIAKYKDLTPAAVQRIQEGTRAAAIDGYEGEKAGGDAAVNAGGKKADKTAKAIARDEAIKAAEATADDKISSGDVFDKSKASSDTLNQLGEFDLGTAAESAKRLSPQLEGKTLTEMETVLDAEVSAARATKKTQPLIDPTDPMKVKTQDQLVYDFADGTLIRVKPKGDKLNPGKVMYSVEVKSATPGKGQDGVAFKVDGRGRAVPKNADELKNPYSPSNPIQWKAFQERVMTSGHRQGVP